MTQVITLPLPDRLYEPIQRIARATNQPVEALVLTALQTSLPLLDGLPDDLMQHLVALETLDTPSLQHVLRETFAPADQHRLAALVQQHGTAPLTDDESAEYQRLQQDAERLMLRKARAAVLLRFRGEQLPTLTELRSTPPTV